MEIRQLRYFVNVAETKSFSEASRQCYLSQSAISQQIKLLEEELGSQLFLRNTHSVTLTEAGEALLPLARMAIKSFDSCQEHMNGIRGLITGQLNIGMSEAMEPFVRHTVMLMLKRYPKLRINMHYKPSYELKEMLLNHELDLAFSIGTPDDKESIESIPVTSYRICAVMNRNHPLAKREKLTAKDLSNQSIILPERGGNALRALGDLVLEELKLMNVRVYSNSVNALLNILQESNYVSFISARSVMSRPMLIAKVVEELPDKVACYAHKLKNVCEKHNCKVFLEIMTQETIPYYNSLGM